MNCYNLYKYFKPVSKQACCLVFNELFLDIGFCFEYIKPFGAIGEGKFTRSLSFWRKSQKNIKVRLDKKRKFYWERRARLVCNCVLFDPEPKSPQYMLTHQLLHRMLARQMECLKDKSKFVQPEVDTELWAKYIANLGVNVPITLLRDLFAEQIFFCGQIGFDSFLRVVWLKKVLSWQSESEYGCFLQEDPLSMDIDEVPRKLTKEEIRQGKGTNEVCETDFTSVGLSTLGTFWDYMEQNCS